MQNGSVQAIVYTCTSLYVHVSCMYGVSGLYERTHSVSVTLFWQKPKRHETVGTADLVVNDWNERRRRRPSVQLTHDTFESNNSSFVDLFPISSTVLLHARTARMPHIYMRYCILDATGRRAYASWSSPNPASAAIARQASAICRRSRVIVDHR